MAEFGGLVMSRSMIFCSDTMKRNQSYIVKGAMLLIENEKLQNELLLHQAIYTTSLLDCWTILTIQHIKLTEHVSQLHSST